MAAAQRVSGLDRFITIVLVLVFLGGSYLAVLGVREAIRRRHPRRWPRPRKSWLRDFRAEARDRDRRQP